VFVILRVRLVGYCTNKRLYLPVTEIRASSWRRRGAVDECWCIVPWSQQHKRRTVHLHSTSK